MLHIAALKATIIDIQILEQSQRRQKILRKLWFVKEERKRPL